MIGNSIIILKEDRYSDVCINACIKLSLSLKGVMVSAFLFRYYKCLKWFQELLEIVNLVMFFSVMDIIRVSCFLATK
jgi:hypothetical protein